MKTRNDIYRRMCDGKRKFATLIDPDKNTPAGIKRIAVQCEKAAVDFIFYGGSLVTNVANGEYIRILKENTKIPVVLFPGNNMQLNADADGILLLSLISGRNPELLIGKHVVAAPFLRKSGIEILPTGYLLIDGGKPTAVSYMSNTIPIPSTKTDIAVCTAMAGEMLGMKLIYMDAGSGAESAVPHDMIRMVKQNVEIPLIVGGGIRSAAEARKIADSGADVIVVGNALEQKPELISRISDAIH